MSKEAVKEFLPRGLDPEVAASFLRLGHPYPAIGHLAYDDLHQDDIIHHEGGILITAGDIRALQEFLLANGHTSPDRLTELLSQGA